MACGPNVAQPPASVNKILLEHRRIHLFTCSVGRRTQPKFWQFISLPWLLIFSWVSLYFLWEYVRPHDPNSDIWRDRTLSRLFWVFVQFCTCTQPSRKLEIWELIKAHYECIILWSVLNFWLIGQSAACLNPNSSLMLAVISVSPLVCHQNCYCFGQCPGIWDFSTFWFKLSQCPLAVEQLVPA